MDKLIFFLALSVFAIMIGILLLGGPANVERLRYESVKTFPLDTTGVGAI